MKKMKLSQEGLKLIACVTMLIDHIGAVFVPGNALRVIGRLAFPIYCFLLAEGIHHTRDPKKYGLRLLVGVLLAELPFDLLFFGRLNWVRCSVMVTLLLGFLYGMAVRRVEKLEHKIVLVLPFMLAADWLGTDYRGWGVAMIALFLLTREMPQRRLVQAVGLALLCWLMGGASIQMFAVAALVPIFCYGGEKATSSRWVQQGFYLFYPVHLTVLLVLAQLL